MKIRILREITASHLQPGELYPRTFSAGEIVDDPPAWLQNLARTGFGRDASGAKAPFAEFLMSATETAHAKPVPPTAPAEKPNEEPTGLPDETAARLEVWAMEKNLESPEAISEALLALSWQELVSACGGIKAAQQVREFLGVKKD